jgi:hypothetical protein
MCGVWNRIGHATEIWSENRKKKDVTAEGRILLKIILKKRYDDLSWINVT